MRYFRKSRQDFSCSVLTSITFIVRKFNRKIKDGRTGRLFAGFFAFTLLGIFACGGNGSADTDGGGNGDRNPTISWSLPTSVTKRRRYSRHNNHDKQPGAYSRAKGCYDTRW